ncbi:MFS transporter [Natrinema sp. LN54]|uniref:MFS transporter n=1 Tax=Natrinema sp. LN54 TaxID=3458705 RepID=UPI00403546DD
MNPRNAIPNSTNHSNGSVDPGDARIANSIEFGILGAIFATWAVRIPAVSASLNLSEGDVAIALLALATGSIIGLMTSGVLVSKYGGRTVIQDGLTVYCLTLLFVGFANNFTTLIIFLLIFGFGKGLIDVAGNSQGIRIEQNYPGQIMGSFHALFSGGGIIGAAFGAIATSLNLSVQTHFTIVGVTLLAVGFVASSWLLPNNSNADAGPTFALPSRKLAGFCAIGFCSLFIEGVGNDWSAVFLETSTDASPTVAALGFAAFSLTMMTGRFLADKIVHRFGPKQFIRIAALVATAGLALILKSTTGIALVGFGVLGLGLAGIMPVALSMAGNHDPSAPTEPAIAAVSTAGYAGFAIGPVAIGLIAEASTLRLAFVPAFVLTLLIVLFTGILPTVARAAHQGEAST